MDRLRRDAEDMKNFSVQAAEEIEILKNNQNADIYENAECHPDLFPAHGVRPFSEILPANQKTACPCNHSGNRQKNGVIRVPAHKEVIAGG